MKSPSWIASGGGPWQRLQSPSAGPPAAVGPGLRAGLDVSAREIDGIVPLVYHLLGETPPAQFSGIPLLAVSQGA